MSDELQQHEQTDEELAAELAGRQSEIDAEATVETEGTSGDDTPEPEPPQTLRSAFPTGPAPTNTHQPPADVPPIDGLVPTSSASRISAPLGKRARRMQARAERSARLKAVREEHQAESIDTGLPLLYEIERKVQPPDGEG